MLGIEELFELLTWDSVDKYHPLLSLAGLSFLVGIFSQYVGVVDYYWRKAFLDYFCVPQLTREKLRLGLHPDYLLYVLAIISIVFVVFSQILACARNNAWSSASCVLMLANVITSLFIGVLSGCTSYFFRKARYAETSGWDPGEFCRGNAIAGVWAFITSLIVFSVFITVVIFLYGNSLMLFVAVAVGLIAAATVLPAVVYFWSKRTIKYYFKEITSCEYEDDIYYILSNRDDALYGITGNMNESTLLLDCRGAAFIPLDQVKELNTVRFGSFSAEGAIEPWPPRCCKKKLVSSDTSE